MSAATQNPTSVTQTEIYTLQKDDKNTFDREVKAIKLSFGKLYVSGNGKDEILTDTDEVTFEDAAAVSIFASEATSCAVTFADNAVMPVFQNATALPAELHHDAAVQGEDEKPKERKTSKSPKTSKSSQSRGDKRGSTGSFDSRTVSELRDLAKERGVTVKGKKGKKAVKGDYVKALRNA